MSYIFRLSLLIAVLGIHSVSANQELQILTVNEPPANYLDEDGELTGYVTDIVKALQTEMGDNTQIKLVPEARAIYIGYKQANVMMYSFSRIPEREADFHWVMPVMKKTWSMVFLAETPVKNKSLESLKSLPGIGVVRGDVRENWLILRGFDNLKPVTTHEQNFKRLLANRVQAIAYEQCAINQVAESLEVDSGLFKSFPFHQSILYLIMSKPGTDPELLAKWSHAVSRLQVSGKLDQITHKWKHYLEQNLSILSQVEDGILVL
ncbi:transporter substrate-binding domain-containing protein [Catenovulum sp. 2E275]|uniref:substrate-binding periplasmic protein n=1 Tax=Catenovulum sp. 2E275 TaxID=2980497 RepID=UPI0021D13804|nr:transporter substrate-binding domain-containing protein [Catenovulum sp. 2E275]MCU4674953.1 transporter substrate-binding domain-containing protein [Catenovulum sp. 2E275]